MDTLPYTIASRQKRLFGSMIEGFIIVGIMFPILAATGQLSRMALGEQPTIKEHIYLILLSHLIFLVLNGHLLTYHGQTIGKRIVKTRIVDLNGQILPFGRVFFLRYVVLGLLGAIVGIIDALFIFREDRRCLHDWVAGTLVIDVDG